MTDQSKIRNFSSLPTLTTEKSTWPTAGTVPRLLPRGARGEMENQLLDSMDLEQGRASPSRPGR